ncbi:hypothetical protein O181_086898 [Austropuccinia psidii MF-1]|uniref:Uncharacterized protein n=1 Tax=Austropuccinia psidii MF-1 TaxID=1389203 RepID=A0A9Q3INP4_9BASI|nr:hypothetical protein [Austropuccinia psidii MF-1]
MAPLFLRGLEYPRNKPEIWRGRNRRGIRQPPAGSNDQKGTYHQGIPSQSPIPNKIQPSPTKKLYRCRNIHSDASTPEIVFHLEYGQQNVHPGSIMGKN